MCKDFLKPDFVKIDVEGAEKNILLNSKIIREAKYIIVEWNQKECFYEFVNKYLDNFEIIKNDFDFLLKNFSL